MTDEFVSVICDGQITKNEQILQTHFKKMIGLQDFIVAVTGPQLIIENILGKFHFRSNLKFDDASNFLTEILKRYQNQHSCNVLMAGFDETGNSHALTFHVENGEISLKTYDKSAVLSLLPDDSDFNPNPIILSNLTKNTENLIFHAQHLQRNALYHVAKKSKTVNTIYFQEIIKKP